LGVKIDKIQVLGADNLFPASRMFKLLKLDQQGLRKRHPRALYARHAFYITGTFCTLKTVNIAYKMLKARFKARGQQQPLIRGYVQARQNTRK